MGKGNGGTRTVSHNYRTLTQEEFETIGDSMNITESERYLLYDHPLDSYIDKGGSSRALNAELRQRKVGDIIYDDLLYDNTIKVLDAVIGKNKAPKNMIVERFVRDNWIEAYKEQLKVGSIIHEYAFSEQVLCEGKTFSHVRQ